MSKSKFYKYNKNDIKLGDIYVFSYNFCYDDFRENSVVEIVLGNDNNMKIKPIKTGYWKSSYECLSNDYLSDFNAIRIFREYN